MPPTGPKIMKEVAACNLPCSAEVKHFSSAKQLEMWFRLHKKKCVLCDCERVTQDFTNKSVPTTAEKITRLNPDTYIKTYLKEIDELKINKRC